MAKRKEIKFRDRAGDLMGRQNGMTFYIFKDKGLEKTCAPAHSVAVFIKETLAEKVRRPCWTGWSGKRTFSRPRPPPVSTWHSRAAW